MQRDDTEQVVIADVRQPHGYQPKTEFHQLDVRDRTAARSLMEAARPDALVHLAFILNPIHDEPLMYDIDVNGTHNVLEAAADGRRPARARGLVVDRLRRVPGQPGAADRGRPGARRPRLLLRPHKTEADRLCQLWALVHPERTMTIVRPCIVFGPNVDNYIVRFWTKQPFQADFGNLDSPIQFVHEDDVVEAFTALLDGRHPASSTSPPTT